MDQIPSDSDANSEFTFDPTNKVVGIVDNAGEAKAALGDLSAAGFKVEEVELLTDEEGARRIDMSDERREVSVHIYRLTQKVPAFYDAPGLLKRIEKELLEEHYFIGVYAEDEEARESVREILKSHGGHFINFYGRWAAQSLEP